MPTHLLGALLGLVLGARHALEPDHLAAISVLATERPGLRRGALLGALWGIGHASAILCVGLLLAALSTEMPDRLATVFELGVALMLLLLGLRAFLRALREGHEGAPGPHSHGAGAAHEHAGPASHVHLGGRSLSTRPLLVGLVHGLAGSGAMTALVVAELSSFWSRLAFLALFGLGSVLSMALLSGLAGWPLSRLCHRPGALRIVSASVGLLSAIFGLSWGWPLAEKLLA